MMFKKMGNKITKKSIAKIVFTPMTALLVVLAISLIGVVAINDSKNAMAVTCTGDPEVDPPECGGTGTGVQQYTLTQCKDPTYANYDSSTCAEKRLIDATSDLTEEEKARIATLESNEATYKGFLAYENKNNLDWQIKSITYYNVISECIDEYQAGWNQAKSEADKGALFPDLMKNVGVGLYLQNTDILNWDTGKKTDHGWDGFVHCHRWEMINEALKVWGIANRYELYCNIGMRWEDQSGATVQQCIDSSANKASDKRIKITLSGENNPTAGQINTKLADYIKQKIYGGLDIKVNNWDTYSGSLAGATYYYYYRHALSVGFCTGDIENGKGNDLTPSDTDDYNYKDLPWVDNTTGDLQLISFSGIEPKSKGAKRAMELAARGGTIEKNCGEIVDMLKSNGHPGAYSQYIKSLIAEKALIAKNGLDITGGGDGKSDTDVPGGPTCGSSAGGLAWVACPLLSTLTAVNSGAWSMFSGLFKTKPLTATDERGQQTGVYQVWSAMRNIANIIFVIVFLIMIFSQLTSFGLDNYGIKKLLPKLIVGAILINLSFLMMQIMFDLANIIGGSLYALLINLSPVLELKAVEGLITSLTTLAIPAAGGAIAVGLVLLSPQAALWIALPVLLAGVFALLAAIFTLVFRLVIIPILAILSPLAFIAYLLPNTANWFKKWKDTLLSMLLVYPLAALLFGGSQLVASIVQGNGWFDHLMACIVLLLPLGALPFIVSKSGAMVGAVAGALTGLALQASKGAKGAMKADERAATHKAASDAEIMNGTRKGGFLGGFYKSSMQHSGERDMRKKNAERSLALTQSEDLANKLKNDKKFLVKMAGKSEKAQVGAMAGAEMTLDKLFSDEMTANGVLIDNFSQEDIQKLSMGESVNVNGRIYDAGKNLALRASAMKKTVDTNDIEGIDNILNSIADSSTRPDNATIQAFGKILETSSGTPSYVSKGVSAELKSLANLDLKGANNLRGQAIANNTYSSDKLVSISKAEASAVLDTAQNIASYKSAKKEVDGTITIETKVVDTTKLVAAAKGTEEPIYAGRASKQQDILDSIKNITV